MYSAQGKLLMANAEAAKRAEALARSNGLHKTADVHAKAARAFEAAAQKYAK